MRIKAFSNEHQLSRGAVVFPYQQQCEVNSSSHMLLNCLVEQQHLGTNSTGNWTTLNWAKHRKCVYGQVKDYLMLTHLLQLIYLIYVNVICIVSQTFSGMPNFRREKKLHTLQFFINY